MIKRLLLSLLAAVAMFAFSPAYAQPQMETGDITLSLEVISSCKFDSATINFGTQKATFPNEKTQVNIDAQGTLTATCVGSPSTASYTVNAGTKPAGGRRQLTNTAFNLTVPYDLYTDSGRTSASMLAAPSLSVPIAGGLTNGKTFTFYGRIPANTTLPFSGSAPKITFTDTVTVTFTY